LKFASFIRKQADANDWMILC